MTKREITIGAVGFTAAVLLAGGGLLLFGHHAPKKVANAKQTVGDHTISLNQTTPSDNSGGLNVTSAGASLGQLNGSSGQSGSSSSSSSSSGSGSNGLDPSTFKQYDKYKDGQSGLFAEVEKGTGTELTDGHKAAVVYKGWLTDGTLFDESQSFAFNQGAHQVISGWEQAINGMKVGGTRLMIIPPAVGYGAQGQGPVPGNAVLVFLVKLVDVQ